VRFKEVVIFEVEDWFATAEEELVLGFREAEV
jgi:hypothetical protein